MSANNSDIIDGLEVPKLIPMLSFTAVNASGRTPDTKLYQAIQAMAQSIDLGFGAKPSVSMFNLTEVHHRLQVGTYFPGIKVPYGTPVSDFPVAPCDGYAVLVRGGGLVDGENSPEISDHELLYCWSDDAGAYVEATPTLFARGLLCASGWLDDLLGHPCADAIYGSFTAPTYTAWDDIAGAGTAGQWYQGADNLIYRCESDTNIDPHATSHPQHGTFWYGGYNEDQWAELNDPQAIVCSWYASLQHIMENYGTIPRTEFGHYDEEAWHDALIRMISASSDASIELGAAGAHGLNQLRINVHTNQFFSGTGAAHSVIAPVWAQWTGQLAGIGLKPSSDGTKLEVDYAVTANHYAGNHLQATTAGNLDVTPPTIAQAIAGNNITFNAGNGTLNVPNGSETVLGVVELSDDTEAVNLDCDKALQPCNLPAVMQRHLNVKVVDGTPPAATGANGSPDGAFPVKLYRQPDGSILDAAGNEIVPAPATPSTGLPTGWGTQVGATFSATSCTSLPGGIYRWLSPTPHLSATFVITEGAAGCYFWAEDDNGDYLFNAFNGPAMGKIGSDIFGIPSAVSVYKEA